MWDASAIFLILQSLQYTQVNGATVFWASRVRACTMTLLPTAGKKKSDVAVSSAHILIGIQIWSKNKYWIQLFPEMGSSVSIVTTQEENRDSIVGNHTCSSSPPNADRLWEPHSTYPNDTEGSFLGYYSRVLTLATHLHIAPKVNYNQVWNYTSTKNGNARSGLYC